MKLIYNKSPIGIGTGVLGYGGGGLFMNCPICGRGFRRAPSHAARVGTNYCSRGCQAEGRKVRVETHCVSCGAPMEQTPTEAVRVTTCGKQCSSLRRRGNAPKKGSFAEYKKAVAEVAVRGKCVKCSTTSGPWVVRKLHFVMTPAVTVDAAVAELWCRQCHLNEIAHSGGIAKKPRGLKTPNAEVSGAGTASAGLPGSAATDGGDDGDMG